MFPLRDHNPSTRTPMVTYALIALNVAIFLLTWPLFSNPRALAQLYMDWGLVPAFVWHQPTGLVTSMFMHGGWLHLGGNMLFLWIFGDNLEDEMGHLGFLAFYLAGGIGAALFQVAADPASFVPVVGASGAIAAVMGGYLLLFPKARIDILFILIVIFKVVPVPAWVMLGLWFLLQLYNGYGAVPGDGGVAYWAHAGGFVAGLVLTIPLWIRLGGAAFWNRTHGHPPHPDAQYQIARSRIPVVKRRGQ